MMFGLDPKVLGIREYSKRVQQALSQERATLATLAIDRQVLPRLCMNFSLGDLNYQLNREDNTSSVAKVVNA